jgi:ribose transport system ATP-binding protein
MDNCLEIRDLLKVYPETIALNKISAKFDSGKVHALLGKNGSGKSTLVKIISGAIMPTSGDLYLSGNRLEIKNPANAFHKRIATVYQELSLVPGLTVAENIFFGRLPKKSFNVIDFKKANKDTEELFKPLGIDISPSMQVSELSIWQRQLVEIVKAMAFEPHVLLLDEPTSSLAQNEAEILFKVISELKKKKVIIIYITHKLQEIWTIADTVTILRDGFLVNTCNIENLTKESLVKMMFGDVVVRTIPKELTFDKEEISLEVKNLTSKRHFRNINFVLHRGEILGIAGLLGSGRSELLRALFGADGYDSGEIYVGRKKLEKCEPIYGKEAGLGFSSENRKEEGLIQIQSVRENLVLACLKAITQGLLISKKKESHYVNKQIQNLQIKVGNAEVKVFSLSGGNQQKVLIGNWINTNPRVLLLDEPSKGIDINAKQQIFEIIWEESKNGVSSIIVSSELEELLQSCHRILVMKNGCITEELLPNHVNVEQLYAKCMEV